jgi:hypothetical protein
MAAQEWDGNGAGMGWEWHRNGMALECFLFLILTSKGFIDCGPGIAQEWYRNDTKWYKMVQEWSRNGTKWYRNGAKWYRNGTGMVQKWYRNGTKNGTAINSTGMVQNGPKNGTGMAHICQPVSGEHLQQNTSPRVPQLRCASTNNSYRC